MNTGIDTMARIAWRFSRPLPLAFAAVMLAGLASTPAAAKPKTEEVHDYGPPPDWTNAREMTEAAVRAKLIDPESARFEWPNGFKTGFWKPFLQPRVYGYILCGRFNSRNRFGGYAGESTFGVVIVNDVIQWVEVDDQASGFASAECQRQGAFPPAPADPTIMAQIALRNVFGLTLGVVPDGAYVANIVSGSVADRAGLKPGMVMVQLNGLTLKGIPLATVQQIVAAADGKATITLAGGTSFTLVAPPFGSPPTRQADAAPHAPIDLLPHQP